MSTLPSQYISFREMQILLSYLTIQYIHTVHSIGLYVGSECVLFDTISSHPDTSGKPHDIGWIKVMSCTESLQSTTIDTFTYHRPDYLSLASNSISIKFQPPGGVNNPNYDNLAVIAKPYSNPIQYGLRNEKETSYKYDSSGNFLSMGDVNNWIGSTQALARLPQTCNTNTFDLHERVYHACGNSDGLHVFPGRDQTIGYTCTWDWSTLLGDDIEVYFGFALNSSLCDTNDPTQNPTSNPTQNPTLSPTRCDNVRGDATSISYGDNIQNVSISYDDGSTFTQIGYETAWTEELRIEFTDITPYTVLRYLVEDLDHTGGFLGLVKYDGIEYGITNPMSNGNWEIISSSDGEINSLLISRDDAGPWYRNPHSTDIDPSTLWVWNTNAGNTMLFQFKFGNIIPITCNPTSDPTIDPTKDPTTDPTVDPTADPTKDPTSNPTTDPTSNPTTDPTLDPTIEPTTDPTSDPTVSPTSDPSSEPTVEPTNNPTEDTTNEPTLDPTRNPTLEPTKAPSQNPTTPAPTDPGELICGSHHTGAYNNKPIQFEVQMSAFDGALRFDAHDSDFIPSNISAIYPNGTIIATWTYGTDGTIATLSVPNLLFGQDVYFTLSAPSTTVSTYDVKISCQSDNPTPSPSIDPTFEPTCHPSIDPTVDPTYVPTLEPSSYPTAAPTKNLLGVFISDRNATLNNWLHRKDSIKLNDRPRFIYVQGTIESILEYINAWTITVDLNTTDLSPGTKFICDKHGKNPPQNEWITFTDASVDRRRLLQTTIDLFITPLLTEFPTIDPTQAPSNDPTNEPTLEPTMVPTTFPTFMPTLEPTVEPSTDPTTFPTEIPSQQPTSNPTSYPSLEPTKSPTPAPTNVPTNNPTTPAPTNPGQLICGAIKTGAYNNRPVDIDVQMSSFNGDIIFDASQSDFQISSITAKDPNLNWEVIDTWNYDPNSINNTLPILIITDLYFGQDVYFTMFGASGATGTFNVQIRCQSDSPTMSPSKNPSSSPTSEPTIEPTRYPTSQARNNFTINVITDDILIDEVERVIVVSLQITDEDVLDRDTIPDPNTYTYLVSVPESVALDSDTVQNIVTEGLVEAYPDASFTVTVQRDDETLNSGPDSELEALLGTTWFYVSIIAVALVCCLVIVCSIVVGYRKRTEALKDEASLGDIQDTKGGTNTDGEYQPGMQMVPPTIGGTDTGGDINYESPGSPTDGGMVWQVNYDNYDNYVTPTPTPFPNGPNGTRSNNTSTGQHTSTLPMENYSTMETIEEEDMYITSDEIVANQNGMHGTPGRGSHGILSGAHGAPDKIRIHEPNGIKKAITAEDLEDSDDDLNNDEEKELEDHEDSVDIVYGNTDQEQDVVSPSGATRELQLKMNGTTTGGDSMYESLTPIPADGDTAGATAGFTDDGTKLIFEAKTSTRL